jgi:hypothetical protein
MDHERQRTCERRKWQKFDGLTQLQRDQLHRRPEPNLSEEEQWFKVWDIVFPDDNRPLSPFIDTDLSDDINAFTEFWMQQGSQMVVDDLDAADDLDLPPDRGDILRRVIEASHRRIYEDWLARYRRDRSNRASAIPTQMLTPANSSNLGSTFSDGSSVYVASPNPSLTSNGRPVGRPPSRMAARPRSRTAMLQNLPSPLANAYMSTPNRHTALGSPFQVPSPSNPLANQSIPPRPTQRRRLDTTQTGAVLGESRTSVQQEQQHSMATTQADLLHQPEPDALATQQLFDNAALSELFDIDPFTYNP